MYIRQPKKMLIMNILDVLRKYSDEEHRLTQKQIIDILRDKYEMVADRKAIRRNLDNLIEFGYEIEYDEVPRKDSDGEEEIICTNYYLVHDFTDEELRMLIDGILFSKYIPYNQCSELIDKLKSLSNVYFSPKVDHVCNLPESAGPNRQLFYTVGILNEAMQKGKKVTFRYLIYGTDKKQQAKVNRKGVPILYTVNPYQMVTTNGRYYMIGNNEGHDNLAHFRVDKIADIALTDEPIESSRKFKELCDQLDLSRHMAEHIYMHSGASESVSFRVDKRRMDDVIDWFGENITLMNETDNSIDVIVRVNLSSMRCWALQYSPFVEVLKPESLRTAIAEDLKNAAEKYCKK